MLALAKSPETAAMNQLREKNNLSTTARWALSSAFAATGKSEIAKQIINGAPTAIQTYRELSYTYGSELRDQAMILENLVLTGNSNAAIQVAQEVSQKLSSGSWYGTQSVAYGLMAMAKFAGKNQLGGEFSFTYNHNGKGNTLKSTAAIAQVTLPAKSATNSFSIKNNGKTPLFVRLILRGQPVVGQLNDKAVASNLNMSVQYKTTKGAPLDPARLTQGTDFIAEITISNPGSLGKKL
ncbi:MAG: hypothetical protein HC817_08420 [Saprospiraceae bacterium]|nr:hypothetical protein [Saprospiraceae bacterium]